jgi:hypothetical protein
MSRFHQIVGAILADGQITDEETALVGEFIQADGQLDSDDVKLLVELYCQADERCEAFDKLFFSVLEGVFISDSQIQPSEEFYLLKLIYSDREITEPEREFLRKLRKQMPKRSASFERLFDTAMNSPSKNWCVGGQPR